MINKETLNQIDLHQLSTCIPEQEFRGYFLDSPGREHYRLLAYYSMQYKGKTLLDIGTYKGCSALALSYNKSNRVISFDILAGLCNVKDYPSNLEFKVGNILEQSYRKLITSSPFILLDTHHEGPFEHEFYNYLKGIGYRGTLMLDDINLNEPMREFWRSIDKPKVEMTEIGHHSGTGIVTF